MAQRPDGNLPLRGFKAQTWEGGFREPGIAWWPGRIKAGGSTDALAEDCTDGQNDRQRRG